MTEEFYLAGFLGLIIGLIAAVVVVNYMAGGLKSVHLKTSAELYYDADRLKLEESSEVFVGSKTEVIPKPRPQNRR